MEKIELDAGSTLFLQHFTSAYRFEKTSSLTLKKKKTYELDDIKSFEIQISNGISIHE